MPVVMIVVRIFLGVMMHRRLARMTVTHGGRPAVRIVRMSPVPVIVVVILLGGRRRVMRGRGRRPHRRPTVVVALPRSGRGGRLLPGELDVRPGREALALLAHFGQDALGTGILILRCAVAAVIVGHAGMVMVMMLVTLLSRSVRLAYGVGEAERGGDILAQTAHFGHAAAYGPSGQGLASRFPRGHGAQFERVTSGRFGHDASIEGHMSGAAGGRGAGSMVRQEGQVGCGRGLGMAADIVVGCGIVGTIAELSALGIALLFFNGAGFFS